MKTEKPTPSGRAGDRSFGETGRARRRSKGRIIQDRLEKLQMWIVKARANLFSLELRFNQGSEEARGAMALLEAKIDELGERIGILEDSEEDPSSDDDDLE